MNLWIADVFINSIGSEFSDRLVQTLLHFVWQGCAVWLVVMAADWLLREASSRWRYWTNVGGLASMLVCFGLTFSLVSARDRTSDRNVEVALTSTEADSAALLPHAAIHETAADNTSDSKQPRIDAAPDEPWALADRQASAAIDISSTSRKTDSLDSLPASAETLSSYAALAYFLGVALMLARLAVGMWGGHRLRQGTIRITDEKVLAMIARQARAIGLGIVPRAAWCERVSVPVVIGIVKPMILLPATMLSGLTPQQLEALLAHEVAHIRRFDLLLNVLQRVVEALLFFHPAVWWVSHRIRIEREHSCDDCVVGAGWGRVEYADALVRMAELCDFRGTVVGMHVAASGNGASHFKRRILRLLGLPGRERFRLSPRGFLGLFCVVLLTFGLIAFRSGPSSSEARAARDANSSAADPKPQVEPPLKDWPQWGGSSLRNNVVADQQVPSTWDLAAKHNVRWTAKLGNHTFSSPVVSGGKVFIGTNNGAGTEERRVEDLSRLICFDAATGAALWQYSSTKLPSGRVHDWPQVGLCSTPFIDGNHLWVVTNRCTVVCLDAEGFRDNENDGKVQNEASTAENAADVIWEFDMMKELGVRPLHQAVSSITGAGDLLLLNTSNGPDESYVKIPAPDAPSFVALNRNTGQLVWQDNSPGKNLLGGQCPGSSPAVGILDGVPQAIFAGGDGWLYSFDLRGIQNGKSELLWRFDCNPKQSEWKLGGQGTRNTLVATPVICDGLVYIAVGRNPEQGEGPGHLWCIDPSKRGDISAELVFNKNAQSGPIPHKPLQACEPEKGDYTIANSNSGVVWHYASADLNKDGKVEFDESMHRAIGSCAIHGGLVLIADTSGIVHCLDAKTGQQFWTHDLMAAVWSTPLIAGDKVIIGDEDGEVAVFRLAKTKQVLAELSVEHSVFGTPALADGTLYIATKNTLLAIAAASSAKASAAVDVDKNPASDDWPVFRANSTATGVAAVPTAPAPTARPTLPDQPELVWTYSVEKGAFEATPIIVGGIVYLGDLDGHFYALDLKTGKEKWKTKQEAGYNSAAAWRNGRLYVGDVDGVFHCLDATNGEQKWQHKTEAEINSAPNFYKENVLFGSQDATLYCLNAASGEEVWKHQIDDQIRCSPTIVEGRAFLAGCDGKLHILDLDKGEVIGNVPIESPTGSTPAALGDMVYFGTEGGTFFGIDWKKQEIVWEFQDRARSQPIRSSAAATPEAIIFGGRDKVVRAMDPKTGQELWKFTTRRGVDSSPVIVRGRVYVAATDGRIYGLNCKTKALEWEYEAGGGFTGSPAVAGGRLVIASDDGHVYCFGAK